MVFLLAAQSTVARWLGTSWTEVWLVVLSAVAVYAAVITYTRISGLRSFSTMSSFDFAMTIAVGSIMASVAVVPNVSLPDGLLGLATLFLAQSAVAVARVKGWGGRVVDNTPALLYGPEGFHRANMRRVRMTEEDIRAKLREANVTDRERVLAVVLETTGDVSVLHGDGPLDEELLRGVRR